MPGVVLCNPLAGPDQPDTGRIRECFAGHDVVECGPDTMTTVIEAALGRRVDFVAVAGGDGSLRRAAEALVESGVPLLPIPTGTRNHFAKDLGIGSLDEAAEAARSGRSRPVDTGRVNGHVFLNNSSIGLYPKIVVRREASRRRLPKGIAQAVAFFEQLRRGGRVAIEVGDRRFQAWLAFVGNGPYGEGLLDLTDRESLEGNVLDVRVVRADMPLARFRVAGALLLGRLARSPLVVRRRTRSLTIRLSRDEVEVALDGEVEQLEPPLRYESVAASLHVLVPAESDAAPAVGS